MIKSDSLVVALENQLSTRLGDETVVLGLGEGVYYGLDAVGTTVWELLREPTPVAELVEAVVREYDVEAERCERDLLELLEQLRSHGLVAVVDGPAA